MIRHAHPAIALLLVAWCAAGCTAPRGHARPDDPVAEAIRDLRAGVDPAEVYLGIVEWPIVESPTRWVEVAEDSRLSNKARAAAACLLLERFVRPPLDLSRFAREQGITGWFRPPTIWEIANVSGSVALWSASEGWLEGTTTWGFAYPPDTRENSFFYAEFRVDWDPADFSSDLEAELKSGREVPLTDIAVMAAGRAVVYTHDLRIEPPEPGDETYTWRREPRRDK